MFQWPHVHLSPSETLLGIAVPALAAHAPCDLMEQCTAVGTAFYNAFFCRLWDGLRNFLWSNHFPFFVKTLLELLWRLGFFFFFPVSHVAKKSIRKNWIQWVWENSLTPPKKNKRFSLSKVELTRLALDLCLSSFELACSFCVLPFFPCYCPL